MYHAREPTGVDLLVWSVMRTAAFEDIDSCLLALASGLGMKTSNHTFNRIGKVLK